MDIGEINYAIRIALNELDKWNDVAGVVTKGSSYYFELQGMIEQSVRIGAKIACEGVNADLDDILD